MPPSTSFAKPDATRAEPPDSGEQRFRLLVESIRDYAIFMLDANGRIASWNKGAQLIKGYSEDEVLGRRIDLFYTPEDLATGRPQMLLELAQRDGRVEDEGWRVRRDGSRFWADVVITALRDAGGQLIGFGKVTRDLTERRTREEQLRHNDERFRLLVDSVKDYAIFLLDATGRVATWNPGAERIKGYRADEIIGEHFSRFYRPEAAATGFCERELETAAREGRFEDEGWRVRKDGTEFWANVVLTAVHDRDGAVTGFVKITRDLTARRRAEEDRLRLSRAQEAIRLRDEFLSVASHELRTPLTAMMLQIESLLEEAPDLDGRVRRRIERAASGAGRLARLVESLLDVSRIATGNFALSPEPVELPAAVALVLDQLRMSADRVAAPLNLISDHPITGHWDRLRVEQLMFNLVANAIKYGAGQPITVTLTRDGDDAVIEVADRGPGIATADLERIFERFQRASSLHHGGLGLGLYVCRQIASAHGGSIVAANRPDGGARFTVRLPLAGRRVDRS